MIFYPLTIDLPCHGDLVLYSTQNGPDRESNPVPFKIKVTFLKKGINLNLPRSNHLSKYFKEYQSSIDIAYFLTKKTFLAVDAFNFFCKSKVRKNFQKVAKTFDFDAFLKKFTYIIWTCHNEIIHYFIVIVII